MKKLGIIGGMGPMATADLYRRVIELTPADSDQEHIETWIGENLYPLGLGIMALTVAGALVPILKRKKEA